MIDSNAMQVDHGAWIRKQCLFVEWKTTGWMEAFDHCEVLEINRQDVINSFQYFDHLELLFRAYARSYARLFRNTSATLMNDVEDPVEHCVAVMTLETDARVLMSRPVLAQLQNKGFSNVLTHLSGKYKELDMEVMSGECALFLDNEGHPCRISQVACLHASRPDGRILVQVGKWKLATQELKSVCQLPAIKMKDREHPRDSVERLIKDKLREFGGCDEVPAKGYLRKERNIEVRSADSYGLQARFLRNIVYVPFDASDEHPAEIVMPEIPLQIFIDEFEKEVMTQCPIYNVAKHSGKEGSLYSWLSQEVLDHLRSDNGQSLLDQWLSHVSEGLFPKHHTGLLTTFRRSIRGF